MKYIIKRDGTKEIFDKVKINKRNLNKKEGKPRIK